MVIINQVLFFLKIMWLHSFKENCREEFSSKKQRKYRKTVNQVLSSLEDALILFNMKTGGNGDYDLKPLHFDNTWTINSSRGTHEKTKGPVDVLWEIENINVLKIREELFSMIQQDSDISSPDKESFFKSIDDFIFRNFLQRRKTLEDRNKGRIHGIFRDFYTQYTKEKAQDFSKKNQMIYKNIALTLANMLYNKNKAFLNNKTGEITKDGLSHIALIFYKTIQNIPNSASSKAFHKIFHDGDFNFLRKEDLKGNPVVGTLNQYIRAIMYLMDPHSFNAYAEDAEEGAKEWAKSKKSFLNNLFASSYLSEEVKQKPQSVKEVFHEDLAEIWKKSSQNENQDVWVATDRFKTDASKMLKLWWKSKNISDESGVRSTYYWNLEASEAIQGYIKEVLESYFKAISNKGIKVVKIQSDRKWNFVNESFESEILQSLSSLINAEQEEEVEILKRMKPWKPNSKLDKLADKYYELTKKKPSLGIQKAYKLANGEVIRGANGAYQDFKLLVEFDGAWFGELMDENWVKKDVSLSQEISFYPQTNELDMGRHDILDFEKKFFNRVKNMNDSELGKTISLNRLRFFAEATLKNSSSDIERYEDSIQRGLLPYPQNDDYAYLSLEGKRVSLRSLDPRTEENTHRMDELICMMLNYFIKQNKLIYINKDQSSYYGLIKPEYLHDEKTYKLRRFTTPDVLKHTALDHKNSSSSICFYTEDSTYTYPNFYHVNLWDLGDFISLENQLKKH